MKAILKEILTPDQLKVIYRLNYTKKQAALAIGKGEMFIYELIENGELGFNPNDGMIPRAEVERYLKSKITYRQQRDFSKYFKR